MAKYNKRHSQGSEKTRDEASKLAKANQRPGQNKEQTKLVAQGIQKGIEQYKKQHKAKSRELDKQLKALAKTKAHVASSDETLNPSEATPQAQRTFLPWILLLASWVIFFIFQLSS